MIATSAVAAPNVVVLLADDQGWGDLGIHGHPSVHTPRIDRLAREGARFERFYVSPVCAPTRAEFLTGRYHLRGGVYDVSDGGERLALREQTIAQVFKAAGYATGCFGKWHNGTQYPYHPNGRGFEEFYGFTSGHWGGYFDAMMDHNGRIETGRGYLADDITGHTIAFIRERAAAGRPFFAYLAFNTPHSPMQVPDAYWESWAGRAIPSDHRYAAREDRAHTRAALAMIENLDWNVGRVLDELERLGLAENTIVVYFSDNGPNGFRWNGNLKGIKGSTDEGGVRSPAFVRWPGHVRAGTHIAEPAAAYDLPSTLTELAGLAATPVLPWDGVSFAAALTEGKPGPRGRLFYAEWRDNVSVRGDRYLLDADGELYDLVDDPGQTRAITGDHPTVVAELTAAVAAWRADMRATKIRPGPELIVGHPGAEFTQLPASDATLHGGLQRSNKYPNSSYVRNWRSTDDALTWAIDVPAPGRFEVEIYYACPAADIGSTIELRSAGGMLTGKIAASWDPPEQGAEHDRVPRQESYVKDFKPLRLGLIDLPAGKNSLTLRATAIPGTTALEFSLLVLRRLSREP